MTEQELAGHVVDWLREQEWQIYQEVKCGALGVVADIVAVRRGITWVIETKMTLSLSLLEQAYNYIWMANYVSVAVPVAYRSRARQFAEKIVRDHGIGLLHVKEHKSEYSSNIHELVHPKIRRPKGVAIKRHLNEQQKTYAAAGNSNGRYWSPFKQTCLNMRQYLTARDGAHLKEVIEHINHHYGCSTTARTAMANWLKEGRVEGVVMRKESGRLRVYLAEGKKA